VGIGSQIEAYVRDHAQVEFSHGFARNAASFCIQEHVKGKAGVEPLQREIRSYSHSPLGDLCQEIDQNRLCILPEREERILRGTRYRIAKLDKRSVI